MPAVQYYELEVQLEKGPHLPEGWSPGRRFCSPGSATLMELAEAIDRSLGRWDLAHRRQFVVGDREYTIGDEEGAGEGATTLDQLKLTTGAKFTYVFDLGDDWRHLGVVLNAAADLYKRWDGWKPKKPEVTYGWGSMPDQYGVDEITDDGPVEDFPEED